MMKTLVAVLAGAALLIAVGVKAEEMGNKGFIHLNNKLCPISGEEVGKMGDPYEVDYKATKVNLCCKMCKKDFEKDPEMYIKKLEAVQAEGKMDADGHTGGHDHAGHAK